MKARIFFIGLAVCWASSFAEYGKNFHFVRDCDAFSEPDSGTPVLCQKRTGEKLEYIEDGGRGFWKMDTRECKGYIEKNCLAIDPDDTPIVLVPIKKRRRAKRREWFLRPRIGLGVDGGLIWGKGGSGATLSNGHGLAASIEGTIPLNETMRTTLVGTVRQLMLTRLVDGSGSLVDSNPIEFSQKITFVGGAVLFGYLIEQWQTTPGDAYFWFMEGGLEYSVPLSATQTQAGGSATSFKSQDKLFFVLLGPTGDFSLSRDFHMVGRLHAFYNLGSRGGSQLFGFRVMLAADLAL